MSLGAVPIGLGLAGAVLFTGTGQELNPFQSTSDGTRIPAEVGDAVTDNAVVPEAAPDDDFFDPPTGTPGAAPSSSEPEPEDAQVTASSSPEGKDKDEESESDGGGGDGAGNGSGNGDGGGHGSGDDSPATAGPAITQVVEIVNNERADAGCDPLKVDAKLTSAAQEHSEDMNARDYMSHENPDGEGPGDRARRHGYDAWGAENVAKGQTSAEQVMDAWMNSAGHRANILDCDLVAIGVGESGNAWTQMFGRE